MNILTISGGLTKDAVLRVTQGGKSVLSFDVANTQGFGDNEHTEYYQCSVWGKRAESLDGRLLKGCKVVVSGENRVQKREHNGKEYVNNTINFANVEVMKWVDSGSASGGTGVGSNQPNQNGQGSAQSPQAANQNANGTFQGNHTPDQAAPANDFDDDIPF